MEDEIFDDTLRLAGWLLAHQIQIAAGGEIPLPIVCFDRDELGAPLMLAPRVSDGSHTHVTAGRVLISEQGGRSSRWAFSYDEDLELSGRAVLVEMGGKGLGDEITIVQRYTLAAEEGFRLLGDFELIGEELLSSATLERLESRRWRYLLTEGATNHAVAGEKWLGWYSARDHERAWLQLGEFSFVVPEGWSFRHNEAVNGWEMVRLLPWQHKGFDPSITTVISTYPDEATLEEVIDTKKAELLEKGDEVSKAEIFPLPSPSSSSKAGRLIWSGESDGRSFQTACVWVPAGVPGKFLLLWLFSFRASWEKAVGGLEAVLASLDLRAGPTRASAQDESKPWLTKLWQKWRR